METDAKDMAQIKHEMKESLNAKVAVIGFYGGLIWSVIGYLFYLLNFTKYGPGLTLAPWAIGDWKAETLGHLIGILLIALLSILIAFAYKFTLAKINNIWIGILFGALLWFIVFYILNPIFPNFEPFTKLGKNTIVTTLCLYILYGLFIGFSVSFEQHEMEQKKEAERKKAQK